MSGGLRTFRNGQPPTDNSELWLEIANEGTNVLLILHHTSDDKFLPVEFRHQPL